MEYKELEDVFINDDDFMGTFEDYIGCKGTRRIDAKTQGVLVYTGQSIKELEDAFINDDDFMGTFEDYIDYLY